MKILNALEKFYDHQAFVVKDIEASKILYSERFGVTVWYQNTYDGYRLAHGFVKGDVIQLIEAPVHNPDNVFSKFLLQRGEGLHHKAYFLKNVAQYKEMLEAFLDLGTQVIMKDEIKEKAFLNVKHICNYAYLDTYDELGFNVEIFNSNILGVNTPNTKFWAEVLLLVDSSAFKESS